MANHKKIVKKKITMHRSSVCSNNKSTWIVEHRESFILLVLTCMITMLIMAYNTSPLVQKMGEDGGIYLLMGRGMLQGKVLYSDLFDHKGPLIFVINALGQVMISGTLGVWILESISMFASMLLLYKIAYHQTGYKASVLIPMLYAFFMGITMNGGDYTEEFGNLFVILSLAIWTYWLKKRELKNRQIFALGIYISIVFFMRPNNIAIIAVIVAYIGIYYILANRKKILPYMLYGVMGILAVTGVVLCYHYFQGTISEMLDATIFHNMKYSLQGNASEKFNYPLLSSFNVVLYGSDLIIFFAGYRCIKAGDKENAIFLFTNMVVVTLSVLVSGRHYVHYEMLICPLLAYALSQRMRLGENEFQRFIQNKKKYRFLTYVVLILILVSNLILVNVKTMRSKIDVYKKDCISLCEQVPQTEKDKIFGYDIPAMWYYVNDIMPPFHYFTMQTWMAETNLQIKKDIIAYVKNEKPRWIVTYMEDAGNNHELRKIILSSYEKKEENIAGYLYKIKE